MDFIGQKLVVFLSGNVTTVTVATVLPAMHFFTYVLLLGSLAFQAIVGSPRLSPSERDGELLKRSVDSFIATESPIALRNLLCNIGANGCYSAGVAPGIVIASPDKTNPDCRCQAPTLGRFNLLTV